MNKTESTRPSIYLLQKADALAVSIAFFARSEENRLVFLAQIDFWDWEVENLIYSYQSFADRQTAWESDAAMRQKLLSMGVSARSGTIRSVEKVRNWTKKRLDKRPAVRAPLDALKHTLEQWNQLLTLCEKKVLDRFAAQGAAMGADLLADLTRYRKAVPKLSAAAETAIEVK